VTLDEAREHIGQSVAYRAAGALAEEGVITSVGNVAVFVRYDGDLHSKATDPADLTLAHGDAGTVG
jgi:hypothetical protein